MRPPASAGADPIQFRINHTTDQRLIDILNATAKAAGWSLSLAVPARAQNRQRFRDARAYASSSQRRLLGWASRKSRHPIHGAVQVTKFTIGADPGKIINPRQLDPA